MKVKYSPGDKVFAKIRGYPYWPAKIVGPQNESSKQIKYDIIFYGSGEKAVVRAEDVVPYLEKKDELGKPKKQKAFNDAISEIERELLSGDAPVNNVELETPTVAEETPTSTVKIKKSVGRPPKQSIENVEGAVSSPLTSSGRKRKTPVENEGEEETINDTTRAGRKIKITKKMSSESGPKITSPKKKTDKIENKFEFEHDGTTYVIPLDTNKPSLSCPKSFLDWNTLINDKANELKDKIIAGEITLQQAKDNLAEYTRVKAIEKRGEYEENAQEFKILKIEAKLIQLDVKIKKSLTITKADTFEACKHLDEMIALPFTALMIKKHPELVETFKRLCRYVGNPNSWSMNEEDKSIFSCQAEKIRGKSQEIIDKIYDLFNVQEGQNFSRTFAQHIRDFSEKTRDLTQDEFFSLVKDPNDIREQ